MEGDDCIIVTKGLEGDQLTSYSFFFLFVCKVIKHIYLWENIQITKLGELFGGTKSRYWGKWEYQIKKLNSDQTRGVTWKKINVNVIIQIKVGFMTLDTSLDISR